MMRGVTKERRQNLSGVGTRPTVGGISGKQEHHKADARLLDSNVRRWPIPAGGRTERATRPRMSKIDPKAAETLVTATVR